MADTSQVKEITAKLKDGIMDLFESDKYAEYLKTMSKFHNYSTNNTLLIHMQRPSATAVAGFQSWQNKFERQVKKGEKAIKIFAPTPFVIREEKEKLDPDTRTPILDENGMPVIETTEKRLARFRVASVFDVSQTQGKPLPVLAQDLSGNVEQYEAFLDALRTVSTLPIVFEPLPENEDGVCRFGDRISIRQGMSQIQTVSAAIHEMTHAKLHDRSLIVGDDDGTVKSKDRRTEEVEAESISYAVCQYFGIETGDNSFGYVASWSKGKELKELNASLDTIRKTATELIDAIDGQFQELVKERNIVIAVGEEQEIVSEQMGNGMTAESDTPPLFRETRNVGETVLMPLLFNEDGNLERTDKRTRVKIEPPIGKYQIYSREIEGTAYGYLMTESGKLVSLGRYDQLVNMDENRIDEIIARQRDFVEIKMQDPDEWVDYNAAAIVNRISEAEAHNAPVRAAREVKREQQRQIVAVENERVLNVKLNEISTALINGDRIEIEPNQLLFVLFDRYNIEIPAATKGWASRTLKAFQLHGDNRLTAWGPKGMKISSAFAQLLIQLKKAISAGLEQQPDVVNNEKNNTIEQLIYQKFKELFPQVVSNEYPYMLLEAEYAKPLSLERIYGDRISIIHSYEEDGVVKYEPMVTLIIDEKNNTMTAYSLELSKPPRYDFVYDEKGNANVEIQQNINNFTLQWVDKIKAQRFIPVKAMMKINGKDTSITFDADGKPIMPKLEKPRMAELDLSLPDPTLTAEDGDSYGYTEPDMYPLSVGRAVELFDTGHTIYLLYPDNTEAMALDGDEIITFSTDGLCGITYADWELSPVRAAQLAVAVKSEGSRESELLYGDGNHFGIYQVKSGMETRDYRFTSLQELEKHGLGVNRNNYELVYTAPFSERIESLTDRYSVLEKIYEDFNINHPADFTGRSVSMSDAIVLKYNGDVSSYYVDNTGFVELDSFLGEEKQQPRTAESPMQDNTYSHVGNRSPEYTGKTVAELEADAKNRKPISLTDLANALNAERNNKRPTATKGKLSLMDRVEKGKEKTARHGQPDANKSKIREV